MTWRTSRLIQVHRSVKLSCGNCITLAHHQGSSPMMRLSAILTMARIKTFMENSLAKAWRVQVWLQAQGTNAHKAK